MIKLIQNVKELIEKNNCLIKKGETIYIPHDINNFCREEYDPITILNYESRNKIFNCSSNEIDFEMIRD